MKAIFAQGSVINCKEGYCDTGLPAVGAGNSQVTTILQIVFGVIAIVTLIYIVLAGLRLITSNGDPQAVAQSRQQIIFAAAGLAVAISAELIVTFVVGRI